MAKRMTLMERFNANHQKLENGCWEWTGEKDMQGYGMVRILPHKDCPDIKRIKGHRLSWMLFNGPLPMHLLICHKCDRRSCVNPEHLFLGTQKDNMRDCIKKGRHMHGIGHVWAKLNPEKVREIRKLKAEGQTYDQLSAKFAVHRITIAQVIQQKTWKEVL